MFFSTRYAAVATAASSDAVLPNRLFRRYGRACFGVIALTASYTAPCTIPMLIWDAGGAPPAGPGIPAIVLTAIRFHWVLAVASAVAGGAADAPRTPSAPRSAPTATAINKTDRL